MRSRVAADKVSAGHSVSIAVQAISSQVVDRVAAADGQEMRGVAEWDAAGKNTQMPANYYHDNDPSRPPENRWRSHAHLLFGNWINEVYQTTPYDPRMIGE